MHARKTWSRGYLSAASRSSQCAGIGTVADYVTVAVAPYIGDQLISPEALLDIQQIATLLPTAITDRFGFECELGIDRPTADFLVCCRTSHGAAEVLAGQKPDFDLPHRLHGHPVWQRIRTFSQQWANSDSPIGREVHNLWLEFDIGLVPSPTPVPSVFIGSNRLRSHVPVADPQAMSRQCAWLTDQALPTLLGSTIEVGARGQMARCINLLPEGACLFQVGLMLARASQTMRLCVRGIERQHIVEYLNALDWQGSRSELESLILSLGKYTARIDLDFDIADRLLPRIGLECYLDAARLPDFMAHLVSSKLCTAPKAEASRLWHGSTKASITPSAWPQGPNTASSLLEHASQGWFERALHHVKIVYQPKEAVQAKAYLGVYHRSIGG
jgi:hypothetical protein